jgi:hypothetical protein
MDDQVSILDRKVTEFQTADPETWPSIINGCINQIERSWREAVEFDRETVDTVCTLGYILPLSYFFQLVCCYLHSKCRQEQKMPNMHRKWTYQDFLVDIHRKELDKMAVDMSGSRLGLAAYHGYYKKAIKTINEGLDEETQVKYRVEAKEWMEKMPPPQQQQRYAHVVLSDGK